MLEKVELLRRLKVFEKYNELLLLGDYPCRYIYLSRGDKSAFDREVKSLERVFDEIKEIEANNPWLFENNKSVSFFVTWPMILKEQIFERKENK